MTPVALPMVHDTIPVIKTKSYTSWPQIPYLRLPGFQNVERNDIVVFNWPADTVNAFRPHDDGQHYIKPIDKKSNYVKRCVGVPGDTLSIIDGIVHIDGKPLDLPERAKPQYSYLGNIKGGGVSPQRLAEEYDITDRVRMGTIGQDPQLVISMAAATDLAAERVRQEGNILTLERQIEDNDTYFPNIFPHDFHFPNNADNFVPTLIPAKGTTVQIDYKNISIYQRIIEVYEGREIGVTNEISISSKQVLLNGAPLTSYTFKQDYYWMMGDNRHNSEDSRFWGFVPENHIVGKPVFIWMSYDMSKGFPNGIRWNRLFTTVGGSGQPVSYFVYFIVLVVIYLVGKRIYKMKKGKLGGNK